MSAWAGAALGAAGGLVMAAVIVAIAVHPPETYRRNMGYTRFSDYDRAARRRVMVACCAFGVIMTVGAAALGAWALPALP